MAAPNPGRRGNWENWDAKNDPSLHFGYDSPRRAWSKPGKRPKLDKAGSFMDPMAI